jgi:hypothetical protein
VSLLPLGRICATPGALALLAEAGVAPAELLSRHASGDWGDIPAEDAAENRLSLEQGFRVMSSYEIDGQRVWVITEADRSSTTLLLPSEY